MASILDLFPSDIGDPAFYQESIVNVLEDFVSTLVASPSTKPIQIAPGEAIEYEYDFYGLLTSKGIPPRYHYITMRINGFIHPAEYARAAPETIESMLTILVPDQREIDQIVQAQNTQALVNLT